jgi:hypothetical protein
MRDNPGHIDPRIERFLIDETLLTVHGENQRRELVQKLSSHLI